VPCVNNYPSGTSKIAFKTKCKNVLRFDEHITVCANVHAQATALLLFETRKLTYRTTRINSTLTTLTVLKAFCKQGLINTYCTVE